MNTATYRKATMAVQGLLAASDPTLVVDGKFGSFTYGVYQKASAADKSAIDKLLTAMGTSVSELRAERVVTKATAATVGKEWIAAEDAEALVRRSASELGMTQYADALVAFLDREAAKQVVSGRKFYNVRSQNGSSRGLMQMQPAAWQDAQKIATDLPSYNDGVWVAAANIKAGVAYAKMNIRIMKQANVQIDGNTLYLAHNQGAGFFTKGKVTNQAGQSKDVQKLIDAYKRPQKS